MSIAARSRWSVQSCIVRSCWAVMPRISANPLHCSCGRLKRHRRTLSGLLLVLFRNTKAKETDMFRGQERQRD